MSAELEQYSRVTRRMWSDRRFRSLSKPAPNAQSLWQYLLTGKRCTALPGLLHVGVLGLAEDLGWPIEDTTRCLQEILDAELARFDPGAPLLWLPNSLRHNLPSNPSTVLGWAQHWKALPECDLRDEAAAAMITRLRLEDDRRDADEEGGLAIAFEVATGRKAFHETALRVGRPKSSGRRGATSSRPTPATPSRKPAPGSRNTVFRQDQDQEQAQDPEQDRSQDHTRPSMQEPRARDGRGEGEDRSETIPAPPPTHPSRAAEPPPGPPEVTFELVAPGRLPAPAPPPPSRAAPPPAPSQATSSRPSSRRSPAPSIPQPAPSQSAHEGDGEPAPKLPEGFETWPALARYLAEGRSGFAASVVAQIEMGRPTITRDQRQALINVFQKIGPPAVLTDDQRFVAEHWRKSREKRKLPTGGAPDQKLIAGYLAKAQAKAASAKPDASGWRPSLRQIAAHGMSCYLAEVDRQIVDAGFPFAWLASSDRLGEKYPMPRLVDVSVEARRAQAKALATPPPVQRSAPPSPEQQAQLEADAADRIARGAYGRRIVMHVAARPVPPAPAESGVRETCEGIGAILSRDTATKGAA